MATPEVPRGEPSSRKALAARQPDAISGAAAQLASKVAEIDGPLEHEVPATRARTSLCLRSPEFPDATYIGLLYRSSYMHGSRTHDVRPATPRANSMASRSSHPGLASTHILNLVPRRLVRLHPLDIRAGRGPDLNLQSAQPPCWS